MNPFRRNTISIYRFPQGTSIDSDAWEYLDFNTMDLVAENVSADIQKKSTTSKPGAALPGDVAQVQIWEIFVDGVQNTIEKGDVVVDMTSPFDVEINKRPRFQVTTSYWTVFQYQLYCEELQT